MLDKEWSPLEPSKNLVAAAEDLKIPTALGALSASSMGKNAIETLLAEFPLIKSLKDLPVSFLRRVKAAVHVSNTATKQLQLWVKENRAIHTFLYCLNYETIVFIPFHFVLFLIFVKCICSVQNYLHTLSIDSSCIWNQAVHCSALSIETRIRCITAPP